MEWPLLALCDERVMCVICVHVCMNEKEVNCSIGYFFLKYFYLFIIGLHWVLVADLTVSARGI